MRGGVQKRRQAQRWATLPHADARVRNENTDQEIGILQGCLGGLGRTRTTDTRIFKQESGHFGAEAMRNLYSKQALGRI